MHKTPRYLLLLVAAFGMSGCNKEWLDPKPQSFYTPEVAFDDPRALRNVLVTCEENMRYEWYATGAPITTQLIFSEVAVEGTTDKASPAQDMNLQITPDAPLHNINYNMIGWYWTNSYEVIKDANIVISRIGQPQYESEAERNAILGAAYFHRAYRYYYLCNGFGDVPLVLQEFSGPKLDFYSTKREVVLQKMKEDLEFAQEWVPDDVAKGEVSKGAVNHLLTKINLSLGLFDDAIESASKVIDGGSYSLMTERFGVDRNDPSKNVIWDLHRPENKALAGNTEALMLVIDRKNMEGNHEGGSLIMYNAVPQWHNNLNTPNGNRGTIDEVGIEVDQATAYGRGVGKARMTWYSTHMIWENAGDDYRYAPGNWMRMEDLVYNNPDLKENGDPSYGKPLQLFSDDGRLLTPDSIRVWFDWPHYKLYIPDDVNTQPRGGHTDWYVYRLAETYLLRAEAYFWKGDLARAAADINAVRTRANATPLTPEEVNIGTVLDERARELYYEEPRKAELTRIAYLFAQTGETAYNGKSYNMENFSEENFWYDRLMEKTDFYNKGVTTVFGNRYTMSPYHVLWPVPAAAINENTQGVINQNKGYTGFERNVPPLTEIPEPEEE